MTSAWGEITDAADRIVYPDGTLHSAEIRNWQMAKLLSSCHSQTRKSALQSEKLQLKQIKLLTEMIGQIC